MTVGDVRERIAPIFPEGYPRARRLLPLMHSAIWPPNPPKVGRDIRRRISRDPLLFALLYLTPYLRDETTGAISISRMHLDIYDRLAWWRGGGPDRSAWVSHRTAGKTVSWFLLAPLYGAAHCGRDFALLLTNTGDQVKPHLATLKSALEGDSLLTYDFPELRPGRPWTVTDARTVGGCRFLAAGMDKNILGARDRERRPKLIVGDDLEPGPADWTPASRAKTLGRLVNDVLPAGSANAAVVLTGTPVGVGSLMHDVVRAARGKPGAGEDRGGWVRAKGFDPHYYPAITSAGESAWLPRWPLSTLLADREADPRTFALQMMCDPDDPAAVQWWTEETFRYDGRFNSDWRILSIDGAVTTSRKADESALTVVAVGPGYGSNRKLCVEHSIAGRWSRTEVKERAWKLTEAYPKTLTTWLVDVTGSGEHWVDALTPPPPGVEIVPFTTTQDSKRHRIETLFDDYARGAILHARPLPALEGQMTAWKPGRTGPAIDDMIDTVRAAKDYALYGDASRAPARRGGGTR